MVENWRDVGSFLDSKVGEALVCDITAMSSTIRTMWQL